MPILDQWDFDLHNDSEIYLAPKPIRWGFITFMDSSGASEALSAFQSRGSDFFRLADFNLRSLLECWMFVSFITCCCCCCCFRCCPQIKHEWIFRKKSRTGAVNSGPQACGMGYTVGHVTSRHGKGQIETTIYRLQFDKWCKDVDLFFKFHSFVVRWHFIQNQDASRGKCFGFHNDI